MQTISVVEEKMSEELMKYHIKGLPFDAVIHKFTGVDVGDPHDHPFAFNSFVLKGWYREKRYIISRDKDYLEQEYLRTKGDSFIVEASTIHSIIDIDPEGCWTLILPQGWERKPGFYKFEDKILHRFWDEEVFKPL